MNRILTLYLFLLLCGTASAQQIVKWDDLQTITDNARRTVYYEKGSKQPLQGEYRIIRGLDEERVKLSDGIINGDYLRYRDGVLRESGIYAKGKRNGIFTEYYQDGVTPRKETPMQQGKIDGTVKTYFRNGKIEIEKEYRQSVESGRAHIVARPGGLKFIKMLWFLIRAEQVRKRGNYDLVISLGKTWNQDMMRVGGGPQKTFWELSEKAWPAGFSRWFKHLRRRLLPSNWLTRIIDNHQYRSGCRIICVSDAVRHWTQKAYPGIPVPEVIYNLPDLSRFTPPTPEQKLLSRIALNIDNNHVAIATATSNFALKGTGILIRSVAMLPETVHLFIAGGRDSEPYQRLAKKLGVAGRIHFLGKVEDMPALYRAMDLFVLPSFYDACSNAVLEALACGLKVLSTTANGSSVFLPQEHVS